MSGTSKERTNDPIKIDEAKAAKLRNATKTEPTISWIFTTEDGKRQVDIPKLGKAILAEHNCVIAENRDKEDFYEYDPKLHYWVHKNIKSLRSIVNSMLDKHNVWTSKVDRDTFLFISNHIERVNWADTFGKLLGYRFNFQNGVWDWETMELIKHDPKYYFTSCVGYPLVIDKRYSDAKTIINDWKDKSTWLETEKWLALSLGENMQAMMEFIGYIFYPSYEPMQLFVILLSPGGDGKTTFMRYTVNLIGKDNVAHVSLVDLADKNGNNFNLSELSGKFLNEYDDISNSRIPDTTVLTKLTGGDDITAPVKNRPAINFNNFAKLFFAANDLPSFRNTTNGFARRINVMPFFRINNFDKTIDMVKVKEERGRFVYKCLILARDAMKRDPAEIKQTNSIIETKNAWLKDNDPVQQFIDENCNLDENSTVSEQDLYNTYYDWCCDKGLKSLSIMRFKHELKNKNIHRKFTRLRIKGVRKRIYFYQGISLLV